MIAQYTNAYGLGAVDAGGAQTPVATTAQAGGVPFFPVSSPDFFRSAEFGLLLALALVVYIDGRILPRRR